MVIDWGTRKKYSLSLSVTFSGDESWLGGLGRFVDWDLARIFLQDLARLFRTDSHLW